MTGKSLALDDLGRLWPKTLDNVFGHNALWYDNRAVLW